MTERLPQHSAAIFLATHSPSEVAKRLRDDDACLKNGQSCSWVALYTPKSGTWEALKIANHLAPSPELSNNIKRAIYESHVARIQQHLHDNGIYGTQNELDAATKNLQASREPGEISYEQLLNGLSRLHGDEEINLDTPVRDVFSLLKRKMGETTLRTSSYNQEVNRAGSNSDDRPISQAVPFDYQRPKAPVIPRKRLCYICRLALTAPHPTQPAMCEPCGAFNLASSRLSIPPNLTLPPMFTALVTGARINLGYHTTLRLLRCGARVLATTRYPRHAVARYAQESDFSEWKDRLKVLGADFRRAADVFALVKETRRCLRDWGGAETLHLLVNNAAQTLTDSVRKEERAIEREGQLLEVTSESGIYLENNYKARVRGGGLLMALDGVEHERGLLRDSSSRPPETATANKVHTDDHAHEIELYSKSSWVQTLFEIPYEDVISAHSVNTFVPLILCRELLPHMGTPRDPTTSTTKPAAYIINVSSREGIFEDRTRASCKAGKHVHTNMSKAALNMITETEAAAAWHSRRVAMNTVDPGYMSAAPEFEAAHGGLRPIGWEDGAGRVLWPVAVGEGEGRAVWGRFLKHYGAVGVDVAAGRG